MRLNLSVETEDSGCMWFAVANVVWERLHGEEHIPRRGTKHFKPGSKVYVLWTHGFMGARTPVGVLGRHRGSGRLVVMRTTPNTLQIGD